MLHWLRIKNVAVIAEAEVEWNKGLNVLTGETGAGKSLLIDAINMILGQRTSKDMVRSGAKKAVVEALLSLDEGAATPLLEAGFAPEEDGTYLISRELFADGKNICRINGRSATVSQLRSYGRAFITIHGQQDNQSLLCSETHLRFLDLFAGEELQTNLKNYYYCYRAYTQAKKTWEALKAAEAGRAREEDILRFQINELEDAALVEGEEEELEQEREILANAERLNAMAQDTYSNLCGTARPAVELLEEAAKTMGDAARFDNGLESMASSLLEITYQVKDIAGEVRAYGENLVFDERRLNDVQERLELIHRLKRKYGATIAEILSYLEESKLKYEQIENFDAALAKAEADVDIYYSQAGQLAKAITEQRRVAAKALEKRVAQELFDLDMEKVTFEIGFTEHELGENGADSVEFLISTNPIEPVRPLIKIASGGEMSRIMLALKTVLAQADPVPTLIFDEIDAGVSGRAAQKIAQKLYDLGHQYQILCITHLPQIASVAQHQYLIQKNEREGSLATTVRPLSYQERIEDIARIIGGERITETTRKSAREMIDFSAG